MTNTTLLSTRSELLDRLNNAQNHPAHAFRDITSIVGCRPVMTNIELASHLAWAERIVSDYKPKARRRRAA